MLAAFPLTGHRDLAGGLMGVAPGSAPFCFFTNVPILSAAATDGAVADRKLAVQNREIAVRDRSYSGAARDRSYSGVCF